MTILGTVRIETYPGQQIQGNLLVCVVQKKGVRVGAALIRMPILGR